MKDELFNQLMISGKPDQNPSEWRAYLEFLEGYFSSKKIRRPYIVELGIRKGYQRKFYKTLFNAKHIGIDISAKRKPDICGSTQNKKTWNRLRCALHHHPIHVLFIDAGHLYGEVKRDLKMYGIFTSHIIALHDIHCKRPGVEVEKLWREISNNSKHDALDLKEIYCPEDKTFEDMGIGLIIKR